MRALVRVVCCAVMALISLPSHAGADTAKAWAAARDNLPATTRAVGALDVAAIMKSPAGAKLFELVMKEERDLREGYALIKKACQIDPAGVIEGLVAAGDPRGDQGVIFVQLALPRAKITACIEAALKAAGAPTPQIKLDGNVAAITVGGDTAYLAWVTGDVVAISIEPEKKAALQAWIGQKGAFAKSAVPAQLAKVDTKAAGWGVLALDRPLDEWVPVLTAQGVLTLAKGTLAGSLRATFADAKKARSIQVDVQDEIGKELGRKSTPDTFKRVLKGIRVSAKGAELTISGSVAEADLVAAIATLL